MSATNLALPNPTLIRVESLASVFGSDRDVDDVPERALFVKLALALYRAGTPTPFIEDDIMRAARGLLVPLRIFCLQSQLTIKFLRTDELPGHVVTVSPSGGLDLRAMAALDDLCEVMSYGGIDESGARAKLDMISCARPLYSPIVVLIAYALSAFGPALLFFGGTPVDGAVACAISLFCGLLDLAGEGRPRIARLKHFVAGAVAGFVGRATSSGGVTTCTVPVAVRRLWHLLALLSSTLFITFCRFVVSTRETINCDVDSRTFRTLLF